MIALACEVCNRRNYATGKNRRTNTGRLELKKYCRWCRLHTLHREAR